MPVIRGLRHASSLRGVAGLAAAGVLGDLIVSGARRIIPDRAGRRVVVRAMAGGIVAGRRLEGERRSLAVQITAGHDSTVSEVTGLVETLRDRNLTDTAWLVAQTLNHAPAPGA